MERILIADDVEIDRAILVALLDGEYDVVECVDGSEVIERLEAEPDGFACLLLDICMPKVNGFGVLEYMRTKNLLAKIPVIALTALSDPEDQIKCYKTGVCDLLEKPYNQQILKYKIRIVIDKMKNPGAAEAV